MRIDFLFIAVCLLLGSPMGAFAQSAPDSNLAVSSRQPTWIPVDKTHVIMAFKPNPAYAPATHTNLSAPPAGVPVGNPVPIYPPTGAPQ